MAEVNSVMRCPKRANALASALVELSDEGLPAGSDISIFKLPVTKTDRICVGNAAIYGLSTYSLPAISLEVDSLPESVVVASKP
jgi:hypothetical protein